MIKKYIDIIVQLIFMLLAIISTIKGRVGGNEDYELFMGLIYFFLGGWQLLSFLFQANYRRPYQLSKLRVFYGIGLIAIIISMAVNAWLSSSFYFFILMGFSTLMAIFYFVISVVELAKRIRFSKHENELVLTSEPVLKERQARKKNSPF